MRLLAKATKKKTTKKSSTKKKVVKKDANIRRKLKPEHHFDLADGKKIKTLFELADELEVMSDEIYNHHATDDRNDFSNWIGEVYQEQELARKVAEAEHRQHAYMTMLKFLVQKMK